MKMNFRIGAKLGLSAGIGVLLVAGMVVNEELSYNSIGRLAEIGDAQNTIRQHVDATLTNMRDSQIARRDVAVAATTAQVEQASAALNKAASDAAGHLNKAIELSSNPENRDRMKKTIAQFDTYANSVREIAKLQSEIVALRAKFAKLGTDWDEGHDEFGKLPGLAQLTGRDGFEAAVREADGAVNDARRFYWRFIVSSESALVERVKTSTDRAVTELMKARAIAGDRSIVAAIDKFIAIVGPLQESTLAAMRATEAQARIFTERGRPAQTAANELLAAIADTAEKSADQSIVQSKAEMARAGWVGLGVGAFVVLVLIGSAVFGALAIARPIRRIGEVLMELANGNKAVDVPYAGRGDEVGDAARAAKTFKENLLHIERMEAEQKEAEARTEAERTKMEAEQKELEARAIAERKADMMKLADSFESAIGGIVNTVSSASHELEAAASTLTQTAETTQQLAGTVAAASEQASSNVHSVASATDEMASSVNEISRQVQESSRIASEAVKQAQKTDARINELSQAASRIGEVVNMITAVAEQTNLLALNATIEAARAGEAGRGFAVVAQEVKALAAQTAKATDEIGKQISGMQTATHESVTAIKEIGETINRVSQIAATIAAAVEEQGAATQEISRNVQQAAQGTAQVAANIAEVNKGAGETGSASIQVLASAQSLSGEGSKLKLEVDKFVATVRAA